MRRDLLRCYYASKNSPTGAIRLYKKQKDIKKNPCKPQAITKLVKKFEETYSLLDAPRSGRPSLQENRTEAILDALQSTANEFHSSSIAKVSDKTGIPWSSVQRILRQKCKLYPYKLRLVQNLTELDKKARMRFATWLLENNSLIPNILWSDETYFSLDGEINRHNCRIWSAMKPDEVLSTCLHPQKVCVWMGFTATFSLKPFFFQSTVTSGNYLMMVREHVRPQLAKKRKLSSVIYMQDGAPPHYALAVRNYLCTTFDKNRVISRGCLNDWPPRSPDLNPLDYWFWGTLKARVFHTDRPRSLEALKARITDECARFTVEEFAAAISNLNSRLYLTLDVDGGHFEQYL